LAAPRSASAGAAVAHALRTSTVWGILAWVAAGTIAIAGVDRRALPPRRRHWPLLLVYTMASAGLAAWWQWGGPRGQLATLAGLSALERSAAALVPVFLLVGTAAQLVVALSLPAPSWRRTAVADLGAHLPLLGMPIAAGVLAQRDPLAVERSSRIAWLALFLLALVAVRTLVAVSFLLAAARDADVHQRRLALAFFAISFGVY